VAGAGGAMRFRPAGAQGGGGAGENVRFLGGRDSEDLGLKLR
jgi:hypothetical protein